MNIPSAISLIDNAVEKFCQKMNKEQEKREKNRESWSESKKEDYEKSLDNLAEANSNYIKSLQNEIISKTKLALKEDYMCRKFVLINPQNIPSELLGYSADDIYKGIWNHKMKRYDRIKHWEAGIEKYPIDELNIKMNPLGYELEEIEENNEIYLEVKLFNPCKI